MTAPLHGRTPVTHGHPFAAAYTGCRVEPVRGFERWPRGGSAVLKTIARTTDVEPGRVRAFEIVRRRRSVGRSTIPLLRTVMIGRSKGNASTIRVPTRVARWAMGSSTGPWSSAPVTEAASRAAAAPSGPRLGCSRCRDQVNARSWTVRGKVALRTIVLAGRPGQLSRLRSVKSPGPLQSGRPQGIHHGCVVAGPAVGDQRAQRVARDGKFQAGSSVPRRYNWRVPRRPFS